MGRTGVPGMAVAVVHDDALVYAKGFGERRLGGGELVTSLSGCGCCSPTALTTAASSSVPLR